MRRLTYENARGARITFYLSPLVIESLTGIGEVEAEVQGQSSPYQDGDTYIDTNLLPRFINLEGSITKTDFVEIKKYRSLIISVCNPKLGLGKITLELDGTIKQIMGALDSVPSFPERGQYPFQQFMITWKCPDPYWQDLSEVSRALRAYEGKFTFPFTFPVQFGTEGDITTLTNDGDTATPVTISIQGPIDRPIIENRTTGEYIQINTEITPEEVLYIDTNPQNKRVEIHRGNQIIKAMGYFDFGGDFWQLEPGDNDIRFTAYRGIADSIAAVSWSNRYVGI